MPGARGAETAGHVYCIVMMIPVYTQFIPEFRQVSGSLRVHSTFDDRRALFAIESKNGTSGFDLEVAYDPGNSTRSFAHSVKPSMADGEAAIQRVRNDEKVMKSRANVLTV